MCAADARRALALTWNAGGGPHCAVALAQEGAWDAGEPLGRWAAGATDTDRAVQALDRKRLVVSLAESAVCRNLLRPLTIPGKLFAAAAIAGALKRRALWVY